MVELNTKPLWDWVNERHAIYLRKAMLEEAEPSVLSKWSNGYLDKIDGDWFRGQAQSWPKGQLTRDPILQQYRFCNVFRELDRVTEWIRYNIRRRYADHPNLWLMLAIARTINWPPTLQALMDDQSSSIDEGWPVDDILFNPDRMADVMQHIADVGDKVYTGAYMIRAESNPHVPWYFWSKHQYIAKIVIGRLWEDRETWATHLRGGNHAEGVTLQSVWERFQQPRYIGWGPFMAYQVVVDMRHTRYLQNAPDINTWAALGPGSRRGLNRLAGRPVTAPLSQEQGLAEMRRIWEEQGGHRPPWVPAIELSDIQNALCETDKYLRVQLGEGRPRAQYIQGRGY